MLWRGGSVVLLAGQLALGCSERPAEPGTWRDPVVLKPGVDGTYQLEMKATKVDIAGRPLCLRTYNGILSPMIDVAAASIPRRVRIDFRNGMTTMDEKWVGGSSCSDKAEQHHFNVTNLHTHGLHVSPEKTADGLFQSDNVLLELHPGMTERYRFDLDEPAAHEAGTFWFHSHVHGSTAIQVSNGMAGALIIRGAIDQLPSLKAARERVFLLQQIPFDAPTVVPHQGPCNDETLSIDDFALATAAKRTLVNGVLTPTIVLPKGQLERWRFIHAGISQTIGLTLRASQAAGGCGPTDGGTPVTAMQAIAADGFTYTAAEAVGTLTLDPGYRADVVMRAPSEPGRYCLIDAATTQGLNGPEDENVVAFLDVTDTAPTTTATPADTELAAMARPVLDCSSPMNTPPRPFIFAQQRDRRSGELCEGQCPAGTPIFNVDCQQYNAADAPMTLALGRSEEWQLSSELGDHPYHIHVNPFTVCAGSVVYGETVKTAHWKDTLMIRKADTSSPIRIRTTYENHRGTFVLHCHKLQHEDQGMMRRVSVQ